MTGYHTRITQKISKDPNSNNLDNNQDRVHDIWGTNSSQRQSDGRFSRRKFYCFKCRTSKTICFPYCNKWSNIRAIQAWFLSNDFKGAAIEVQSLEDFTWLNASNSPVENKFVRDAASLELKFHSPKNLSLLNYLRFYIPEIYPQLEKVVFLEDDIVVQKDLIPIFSIDLHGNVNGAVETCLEAFHRYFNYLNFSNPLISKKFDPQACGWAFGMNVFDLIYWKKANVTAKYHHWQEQNDDKSVTLEAWFSSSWPFSFLWNDKPLDRHVLGSEHDMNIDNCLIKTAAVIHFNGNSKPWLKCSIDRYRPLWERYADRDHRYIRDCATS